MSRRATPLLWALFSAGGTLAAFLFPIHFLLTGLAFPLGWLHAPSYAYVMGVLEHPLARLYFFFLICLPLFHWAHRFRYTLYDGLKLKHLSTLIAVICYGAAALGTVMAAYTLWSVA